MPEFCPSSIAGSVMKYPKGNKETFKVNTCSHRTPKQTSQTKASPSFECGMRAKLEPAQRLRPVSVRSGGETETEPAAQSVLER
ncbi:hypothetical protein NDU88_002937 [Pleurodeles waltl]|uniref:Uncharacterized protein n=1 Tax=Pleurodeles waltl TaxID=8319 RepID=A0AAV7WMM2_PLEWA|nr:hypothetical protein NDU88_002937 [Pleurodeles waltl]